MARCSNVFVPVIIRRRLVRTPPSRTRRGGVTCGLPTAAHPAVWYSNRAARAALRSGSPAAAHHLGRGLHGACILLLAALFETPCAARGAAGVIPEQRSVGWLRAMWDAVVTV